MNVEAPGEAPSAWPDLPEPYRPEQFLDIIADCSKLDRSLLVPSATMESLGIPSLDMVDILFEIEEKFDVYVPMGEEMGNIVHLADFVAMLADLIRNGSAPPETA
jgi:acyl carrier protein